MSNRNLLNNEGLPKSRRTYLCLPKVEEMAEFLSAVKESMELHHPWVEAPSSEDKFEQYIQRINFDSHLGFFIRQRSDRQLIGVVNINEIVKGVFQSGYLGFYAFKKCSGQGLMTEGLSLILDVYFKTLKLHRLEANIQPENSKSISLIKRLNFRREGFSPKYLKINGQWRDHERYAMTLEDYEESINE